MILNVRNTVFLFGIAALSFYACRKNASPTNQAPPPIISTKEKIVMKQVPNFPGIGRQMPLALSINTKGYVGLGNSIGDIIYNDLWEFNPGDNSWKRMADFPGQAKGLRTSFTIGDKGYVVNGICDCNEFWEFDPSKNVWTRRADFPIPDLYWSTAFTINGKAYVGTGLSRGASISDLWEYDPKTDKWTKKASRPGPAVDAAIGFSINDKGYTVGGSHEGNWTQTVWKYDPLQDAWTKMKDFPQFPGLDAEPAFVLSNKAYVRSRAGFWIYDPKIDGWSQYYDFEVCTSIGANGFLIGDKGYVGLGTSSYTVYPTDFWEFSVTK